MAFAIGNIFKRDPAHYEGVRRINIYLLRVLYALMFFMLGQTCWTEILTHRGPWEPNEALAWSVWTGFSVLAGLGILHPLKMLPILLLEIFYKVLWLLLVAYPLWSKGMLAGSPAEGITEVFFPVFLVFLIIPWGYVFKQYSPFRRER
ncbi:MAG: hypothetical protein HOP03_04895 [Lysobacter sp.]|nr:hypothetical protein [Lysobacter sp.]